MDGLSDGLGRRWAGLRMGWAGRWAALRMGRAENGCG